MAGENSDDEVNSKIWRRAYMFGLGKYSFGFGWLCDWRKAAHSAHTHKHSDETC